MHLDTPDLCSATPMRYGPGSALLSLGTLRFIPLIVVTLGLSCHDTSLICVTNRCLVAELIIRWEKESTSNTPSILCPVILSTFLGKLPNIQKTFLDITECARIIMWYSMLILPIKIVFFNPDLHLVFSMKIWKKRRPDTLVWQYREC